MHNGAKVLPRLFQGGVRRRLCQVGAALRLRGFVPTDRQPDHVYRHWRNPRQLFPPNDNIFCLLPEKIETGRDHGRDPAAREPHPGLAGPPVRCTSQQPVNQLDIGHVRH